MRLGSGGFVTRIVTRRKAQRPEPGLARPGCAASQQQPAAYGQTGVPAVTSRYRAHSGPALHLPAPRAQKRLIWTAVADAISAVALGGSVRVLFDFPSLLSVIPFVTATR